MPWLPGMAIEQKFEPRRRQERQEKDKTSISLRLRGEIWSRFLLSHTLQGNHIGLGVEL